MSVSLPCRFSLAFLRHYVAIWAVTDSLSLALRVEAVSLSGFETNALIISRTGYVSKPVERLGYSRPSINYRHNLWSGSCVFMIKKNLLESQGTHCHPPSKVVLCIHTSKSLQKNNKSNEREETWQHTMQVYYFRNRALEEQQTWQQPCQPREPPLALCSLHGLLRDYFK